jgi:predicted nucleotidyltransferase
MDLAQRLKANRAEILRLAEKHGASNVRLFGSLARGEAGPDSDVDLLVEMNERHTPFFPGGLIADLEDLLGCRVEVVTENGLHWYVRDRVLKEAVPL